MSHLAASNPLIYRPYIALPYHLQSSGPCSIGIGRIAHLLRNMKPWPAIQFAQIPRHCEPQSDFLAGISSVLGTCIPTPLSFLSTLFGNLSIVAWLFAQLPQVFKNYRLQSTAGLSVYFVVEWLLGDTTNLVGAILTRQATWQVVLATYYTTVDIILVCQYLYYTHLKKGGEKIPLLEDATAYDEAQAGDRPASTPRPRLQRPSDSSGDSGRGQRPSPATRSRKPGLSSFRSPSNGSSPHEKASPVPSGPQVRSQRKQSIFPELSPKTLIAVTLLCVVTSHAAPLSGELALDTPANDDHSAFAKEAIGRTVSWLSAFLYLGSRVPQIYKNHTRRSTAGLSPTLFVAAFFGNLFYSSSLLTNPLAWEDCRPYGHHGWAPPEGSDRAEWVGAAVPFFLGAAGVLALDLTVGIQFLIFGEGSGEPKAIVVEEPDADGHPHTRRVSVSGWMRGWIPSPTPGQGFGRVFDQGSDDERPLLQRGNSHEHARQYGSSAHRE